MMALTVAMVSNNDERYDSSRDSGEVVAMSNSTMRRSFHIHFMSSCLCVLCGFIQGHPLLFYLALLYSEGLDPLQSSRSKRVLSCFDVNELTWQRRSVVGGQLESK